MVSEPSRSYFGELRASSVPSCECSLQFTPLPGLDALVFPSYFHLHIHACCLHPVARSHSPRPRSVRRCADALRKRFAMTTRQWCNPCIHRTEHGNITYRSLQPSFIARGYK
eukprot:6198805-Pleurochrysis_carterae.AAC.1